MAKANMFSSSKVYYAYKIGSNVAILAISILLLAYFLNPVTLVLSAAAMALFWQQCGWLAHDFLHHQVFADRKWNNFFGYIIGNLAQGFAVSWWKNKHNLHHAAPNVVEFDTDIQTLPFLAWSEKMIDHELDGLPDFLVRNQKYVYWPLLCVARISWLIQSLLWPVFHQKKRYMEAVPLVLHWAWYLFVLHRYLTLGQAVVFFVLSQCLCGFLLGVVFTLGHNGMDVFGKTEFHNSDFINVQLATTRDVTGPLFVHWFMGGLDYQLEHHIWPSVPRHNLSRVREAYLQPFCESYGLKMKLTSFFPGLAETVARLDSVTSFYQKSKDTKKSD
jgi:fatty acid desaturase